MSDDTVRTGGCLCEGVRYRITGEIRDVVNCFCGQCRKTSGHYFAATCCCKKQFYLLEQSTLTWYISSQAARRGFCDRCGSSLFWEPTHGETISITAGTLDKPVNLKTVRNIYVEDMSDYHEIPRLCTNV